MTNACPDLVALEGASSASTRSHLADCSSCRLVVELLEERRRGLAERDLQRECARFEMLIAAREEGTIGGTAGELLAVHLRECADCAAVAATLVPTSERNAQVSLPAVSTASYALGREVARGGMGRILEALDVRIGRPVAVKELLGKAPALAARFEREARITARLQHPGIVPIYEIGRWPDGTPFYAMRMVEGRTLREAIQDKKTLDERLALLPALIAAADAIAFAHGKQIIHRDLTPNNILVGAYGDTVVIDWGLAKDLSDPTDDLAVGPYRDVPGLNTHLTNVGAVIGTAAYMPPEQASGSTVDERADVYALGSILYHVLAGTPPYRASASEEVVNQVKAGPPESITTVAPGAPRDLVSIVGKAMSRDATERYSTASELADELRRFQTGRLVEAHHYSRGELIRRWVRLRRAAVIVFAVAAVALATGGVFAISNVFNERDRAETEQHDAVAARGVAETQRKESHALNVTLLAEQGRQELLAGHPTRALPFLSAAYGDGDASAETRFMIAAAMHEVDGQEYVFQLATSGEKVRETEFSDDSALLLAIRASSIDVLDLAHNAKRVTLRAPDATFDGAIFSHDGTQVVAWDEKRPRAYLFDLGSGALRVLDGHSRPIIKAIFAPGDKQLVTVSRDSTWRRWDLAAGSSQSFTLAEPQDEHRRTMPKLDRKGTHLATIGKKGTVEIWDVARGVRTMSLASSSLSADLSSDGLHVVTCGDNAAALWDARTGRAIAKVAGRDHVVLTCMFSPDDAAILVGGDAGSIDVWDAAFATKTASMTDPMSPAIGWFAGSRSRVVSRNLFGAGALLWDVELQSQIASYETADESSSISGDGRRLAVVDRGKISVLRLDRTRLVRRYAARGVTSLWGSRDGSRVVAKTVDGALALHDVDRDARIGDVVLREPLDIGGKYLVAVTPQSEVVALDLTTGGVARRWPPIVKPEALVVAPAGDRVLVVGGQRATVLDIKTGATVASLAIGTDHAVISPNGTRVFALSTPPKQVVVWDVQSAVPLTTIELVGPPLFNLMFPSPDGSRVAFPCLTDKVVLTLYNASTGAELAKLEDAVVPSFATRSDRMIASGFAGVLYVVRPSNGAELAKLPIASGSLLAQVTDDGTRFTVEGPNGISEVRSLVDGRALWRVTTRSLLPQLDPESRDITYSFPSQLWDPPDLLFVNGFIDPKLSALATWDIHLETRSPKEIANLVTERVPWRLDNGRLVPKDQPLVPTESPLKAKTERRCPITIRYTGPGTDVLMRGHFAPDGWLPRAPMAKTAHGFETTVTLADQQDLEYQFFVDGHWIPDPENPRKIADEHGGFKSIRRVDCNASTGAPAP